MLDDRAALDIDDLLKIILVLVIVLLAIEVVESIIGFLLPAFLTPFVGVILLVLIVAWYFDVI